VDNQVREGDEDLCTRLLRNKYLKDKGVFCGNAREGSQFWKGFHEAKHICQSGLKYVVGKWKKNLDFGMRFA
jgi:hypothetical protein